SRVDGRGARRRVGDREVERTALAELADDPHPAAVRFDDRPRDRQTEAEAAAVVLADLREALEHRLEHVGRDSRAGIADGDTELPARALAAEGDGPASRRELERVR